MTKLNCEKCGKEFNTKSRYTQHINRKTPCVTPTISTTPQLPVTIDSSSFDELKKYYNEVLNVDKIKSLGWKPQIELRQGITQTYEWYKKNLL